MNIFNQCNNIFIDFDGVVVDSNKFKEKAIEKSIFEIVGTNQTSIRAINYFNENAGVSRHKKLSKFFDSYDTSAILKIYSQECITFFQIETPTTGLDKFLNCIKQSNSLIKIYILSGGEENEIKLFLEKNNLLKFFEGILGSKQSKFNHLKNLEAKENDIFVGDSKNDLKVSLQIGLKFILFEKYKSFKSFPSQDLINGNVYIRTQNFQTLINNFFYG